MAYSHTIKPNKTNIDWRNRELWLQVVVDTKELKPRGKLITVPYAFHSESSEKLSANNEIEINNSKVYIGIYGKNHITNLSKIKGDEIEYLKNLKTHK